MLDFLNRILNQQFRRTGELAELLIEEQTAADYPPQIVRIKGLHSLDNSALYRFDIADIDFLPFFSKGSQLNRPPRSLTSFCDYILFTQNAGQLTVFLIELKRGDTSGAEKQLDASRLFIEYVLATASRISQENDMDVDYSHVDFRKLVLADTRSTKRTLCPIYMENRVTSELQVIPCSCSFNPTHYL